jgi:N-acetylmuramoyl-L-alanine amidase
MKTEAIATMEIKQNLTTQNFDTGTTSRIKYIVIHYTANDGDTALGNTNYFKSYRGASAHYFVDENNIYQSVEDKNIAWHCGANKYYHSYCRNANSLGVELCSVKNNGVYGFKDKTVDNAVELTKLLMQKYNVPAANVVRHYDVTHKNCPEPYVRDETAWSKFKARLEEATEVVTQQKIKLDGKLKTVNAIVKDGYTYIKVRDLSDVVNVGWDADNKVVIVNSK